MQYKTYVEQMLDEDPAKREAWSAETSALIYRTFSRKWLHFICKKLKNKVA